MLPSRDGGVADGVGVGVDRAWPADWRRFLTESCRIWTPSALNRCCDDREHEG